MIRPFVHPPSFQKMLQANPSFAALTIPFLTEHESGTRQPLWSLNRALEEGLFSTPVFGNPSAYMHTYIYEDALYPYPHLRIPHAPQELCLSKSEAQNVLRQVNTPSTQYTWQFHTPPQDQRLKDIATAARAIAQVATDNLAATLRQDVGVDFSIENGTPNATDLSRPTLDVSFTSSDAAWNTDSDRLLEIHSQSATEEFDRYLDHISWTQEDTWTYRMFQPFEEMTMDGIVSTFFLTQILHERDHSSGRTAHQQLENLAFKESLFA